MKNSKFLNDLVSILPVSVRTELGSIKRVFNKKYYKVKQKISPTFVNKQDLADAFRAVGLNRGDDVFMHSSMSAFGTIVGGPPTVIEALRKTLGVQGVIAMPAYPMAGSFYEYQKKRRTFDARSDRSGMGAITETFRKMEGTWRSVHPTHSVCANGKNAAGFVADHEKCLTPFTLGSPFEKAVEQNFKLLLFGVNFGPVTIYHVLEDRLGKDYPFRVYDERVHSIQCIDMEGKQVIVRTPKHRTELARRRIDNYPPVQNRLYRLLQKGHLFQQVSLGKGKIISIELNVLFEALDRFLKKGITIYEKKV